MWLARGEPRLRRDVLERLSDRSADLFVSSAGIAELCIKASLGKLQLPVPPEADIQMAFTQLLDGIGATALDVTLAHAVRLRDLPLHHRDPFDRLIIAQAMVENLTLVTHDRALARYEGVAVLWA